MRFGDFHIFRGAVSEGVEGNNEGGLVMVHFTAEGEEASQGDGAERGASIGEGAGVKEGRGEKCELFVRVKGHFAIQHKCKSLTNIVSSRVA